MRTPIPPLADDVPAGVPEFDMGIEIDVRDVGEAIEAIEQDDRPIAGSGGWPTPKR